MASDNDNESRYMTWRSFLLFFLPIWGMSLTLPIGVSVYLVNHHESQSSHKEAVTLVVFREHQAAQQLLESQRMKDVDRLEIQIQTLQRDVTELMRVIAADVRSHDRTSPRD